MKTPPRPGRLDRGERELHLQLIEVGLCGLRDLVVALAKRYPTTEAPLTGVVEDTLRNLRTGVFLLQRRHKRCLKLS
jgi:hypothetical protein